MTLAAEVAKHQWWHSIELGDGVVTKGGVAVSLGQTRVTFRTQSVLRRRVGVRLTPPPPSRPLDVQGTQGGAALGW